MRLPDDAVVGILCGSLRYGEMLRQSCEAYADRANILQPQLLGDPDGCARLLSAVDAVAIPEQYEKYASAAELEQLHTFAQQKPLLQCAYRIDEGSFMYVEDKIRRLHEKQRI